MPRAGRFALLLLPALGALACNSKSALLMTRDGGGGAGGASGASGTGGSTGGFSGASGGNAGGASGTAGGVGGSASGGRGGGAGAPGGASGTGGGGTSGTGGGGTSGIGGAGASGTGGGGVSGTSGSGISGSGGGGASGTGGGGGGGAGGVAGAPPLPTLDAPCDWRGAGDAIHLAFTPDGKLLLAASGNYVRAFDAATGAHAFISRWHAASLIGVAASPDGRWFATFGGSNAFTTYNGGAAVWQIGDRSRGQMLVSDQSVDALGFSSDSTLLAVAMWLPKTIAIFDLATLSMVASVNKADLGSASGLTMSTDGYRLTYQGSQTFVVASGTPWFGERYPSSGSPRPATYFDWSPASNIAASLEGSAISLNYQIPNLSPSGIGTPTDAVAFTAVALSHGGYQAAAGQQDGRVSLWQLGSTPFNPSTMSLPAFTTQVGRITAVAFSPDDGRVASASEDGTIYVRRAGDGSPVWHAEGPSPTVWGTSILAVSPGSRRLLVFSGAYGPVDGSLLSVPSHGSVMDMDKDVVYGVLDAGSPLTTGIQGTCVGSGDATSMACPADVILYSALDGSQVTTGTPTGGGATASRGGIALAPDHARIVEPIFPDGLWSWPLPAGAPGELFSPGSFAGIAKLLFSGDGGTLASVTTSIGAAPIHVWDARSGALLGIWGATTVGAPESFLGDVAISYAGDVVAAVGQQSPSIAVVRPRAGTSQWVTATAGGNVGFSAVALSPDGTRMAASPYFSAQIALPARHGLAVFGTDGKLIARTASHRPYGYMNLIAMPDNHTLLAGEDDGIVSIWCVP